MAERGPRAIPFNIRLPVWAVEYIDRRSVDQGTTKTQVVVEALACLRAEDLNSLMRQGYEEMRELNRSMADEASAVSTDGGQE